MAAQSLIILGASGFGFLGIIHVVYTFFTHKLDPRDASTTEARKATSPILTRQTSIWDAWIGFNASHGLGIILFAAVYLVLAGRHTSVLRQSPALLWLPVVGGGAYLGLAQRYWFRTRYDVVIGTLWGMAEDAGRRRNLKWMGEVAESAFLHKAMELGLAVAKPWGDSSRYDFIVDTGERLLRVQVKSTGCLCEERYAISAH